MAFVAQELISLERCERCYSKIGTYQFNAMLSHAGVGTCRKKLKRRRSAWPVAFRSLPFEALNSSAHLLMNLCGVLTQI